MLGPVDSWFRRLTALFAAVSIVLAWQPCAIGAASSALASSAFASSALASSAFASSALASGNAEEELDGAASARPADESTSLLLGLQSFSEAIELALEETEEEEEQESETEDSKSLAERDVASFFGSASSQLLRLNPESIPGQPRYMNTPGARAPPTA